MHMYIYTLYVYIHLLVTHREMKNRINLRSVTYRNALQHTATHCNTLTASNCNPLGFVAFTFWNPLQPTGAHCSPLQPHCNSVHISESPHRNNPTVSCWWGLLRRQNKLVVLQCVAVHCSVLQCVARFSSEDFWEDKTSSHVAVHCSVLQCVVVHCSVLQCIAVRCTFS